MFLPAPVFSVGFQLFKSFQKVPVGGFWFLDSRCPMTKATDSFVLERVETTIAVAFDNYTIRFSRACQVNMFDLPFSFVCWQDLGTLTYDRVFFKRAFSIWQNKYVFPPRDFMIFFGDQRCACFLFKISNNSFGIFSSRKSDN